jgi:hypothetical protein
MQRFGRTLERFVVSSSCPAFPLVEIWLVSSCDAYQGHQCSNGTFINSDRCSPEGLESDPYELESDGSIFHSVTDLWYVQFSRSSSTTLISISHSHRLSLVCLIPLVLTRTTIPFSYVSQNICHQPPHPCLFSRTSLGTPIHPLCHLPASEQNPGTHQQS